jgi:Domain of unknown function (DUF6894)
MDRFYFDLAGDFAAHDFVGHGCANEDEAEEHGRFIAQRIGTEKPEMARRGYYILVRDEAGHEIYRAPITSALKVSA